jgi:hypothetical protein
MDRSQSTNPGHSSGNLRPAQPQREDPVVSQPATLENCAEDFADAQARKKGEQPAGGDGEFA